LTKITCCDHKGPTLKLAVHQYYPKVVIEDGNSKSDHRMIKFNLQLRV